MNNVKRERESNRAILILIFVAVCIFGIVFFAARGRFVLPMGNQFVMTAVAPFQRAAAWAGGKIHDISEEIHGVFTVHEQNKMLRHEVEQLRVQNLRASEYAAENIRLRTLLNYKQAATYYDLVACRVIGREASDWTRMIIIDKGSSDGIQKNMAVVTERGLVGCVVEAGPVSSKVELILDPRAAVGTLVQRSRIAGIVGGDFDNPMRPLMRNIPRNVDVKEGDNIVTSGFGGVYPKGILVGRVQSVQKDSGGLLQYAVLETAVDFEKLEDVAVITVVKGAPPEPEPPPKQTPGTETNPASALAAQSAPMPSNPVENNLPASVNQPVVQQTTPAQTEKVVEQTAPEKQAPHPAPPTRTAPAAKPEGIKR